jgi:hypothetical protein
VVSISQNKHSKYNLLMMLSRVDLRPVSSHDTSTAPEADEIASTPVADASHRRRSAFRDILSLRHRPNASAEERIIALRRLREQRGNPGGDVIESQPSSSGTDEATNPRDRNSRRMSARLSDVFTGRSRRDRREASPMAQGESSRNEAPPPPAQDASPQMRQI